MHQQLVVREVFVEAGLQRTGEDQRATGALEIEHFERLEWGGLRMQPLENAIALLDAGVRRLSEPLVGHHGRRAYAEYAGVRSGVECSRSRRGLAVSCSGMSTWPRLISMPPLR